jgi:uncharacterized protein YciI
MFIIDVKYTGSIEQIDALLATHRQWLDQYYQQGLFLCSGPRNPRTGGVIIAANTSRDELSQIVQNDPFAQAGIAEYEIAEFKAVKVSPQLRDYQEV